MNDVKPMSDTESITLIREALENLPFPCPVCSYSTRHAANCSVGAAIAAVGNLTGLPARLRRLQHNEGVLRSALDTVLKSGTPNQRDHPSMSAAWRVGADALLDAAPGEPVVDADGRCGAACQFWKAGIGVGTARCTMLGRELGYYDGFLAECTIEPMRKGGE